MAIEEEVEMKARHAAGVEGPAWADGEGAHGVSAKRMPYTTMEFRAEIARVKRKRCVVATLCAIAAVLVALIVAIVLVFRVPQSLREVTTSEMDPALSKGQVVMTERVEAPSSGDVVVYRGASGDERFGRVLAVSGEWVNISSDGSIVISEVSLEGSESSEVVKAGQRIVVSRQVPSASCFVVTDKAVGSDDLIVALDSPVGYRSIVGRVAYRIWPPFA